MPDDQESDEPPAELVHHILESEPPPTGKSEDPAPNAAMGFLSLLLAPLFRRRG